MAVVVPYVIMTVVGIATTWIMMALQKPIEGAKLGDIATQTSKEGGPRLIIYGIVRPVAGNIIACSEPNVVENTTGGGKGGMGGAPEQTTQSIYRTYAIGISEGPVTGIRRVWRNNKIVYDSRMESGVLNTWGTENNAVFLQKAKFYLGNFTQLPDPSLEAIWGVGNIPAHRGTCYMVMNNEDLTELGGALPQYIFEVERAEGIYLTSKPYALEVVEEVKVHSGIITGGEFRELLHQYDNGINNVYTKEAGIVSGTFNDLLSAMDVGYEEVNTGTGYVTGGTFNDLLNDYVNGLPENAYTKEGHITGGAFNNLLIEYIYGESESIETLYGKITGGTHETP